MGFETQIVQPAAVQALAKMGFECEREVVLPNRRRIDILACKGRELLIVECKRDCSDLRSTINQVLDYTRFYANAQPVIAVPRYSLHPETSELLSRFDVRLIALDLPRSLRQQVGWMVAALLHNLLVSALIVATMSIAFTIHPDLYLFDAFIPAGVLTFADYLLRGQKKFR